MPQLHCPIDDSLIVAIDMQPSFLAVIQESERVLERSAFLLQVAKTLAIPVLATEQNPDRMGGSDYRLHKLLPPPISKVAFSSWCAAEFRESIEAAGRQSIVLLGIETHICVTLTALDLLNSGYRVFVCPDAVSARTPEQHKLGMERMRDSGAMPAHTESLAYEWLGSAEHPKFKEVLGYVKAPSSCLAQ